jgi:hypothetical protein
VIRNTTITVRRTFVAAVLSLALIAVVSPAFAAAQGSSPTQGQHVTAIHQQHDPTATGSGLNGRVGPLPFTGFDVLGMAGIALAVTALGLVLQRAVSRRPYEDVSDRARL